MQIVLEENELHNHQSFLENGYIIVKNSTNTYEKIQDELTSIFEMDLNRIHQSDLKDINPIRLDAIKRLNQDHSFHHSIYNDFKSYIYSLVGNELAMQKNINLSIHRPNISDDLLDIHSDSLCGNSNYELTVWMPLTRAYDSNSMYILPLKDSVQAITKLKNGEYKTIDNLKEDVKSKYKFINIDPGETLLFSHNLLHGNIINETSETRCSINMRFKSLLTPYDQKEMGSYYIPISPKPVTKLGNMFDEL